MSLHKLQQLLPILSALSEQDMQGLHQQLLQQKLAAGPGELQHQDLQNQLMQSDLEHAPEQHQLQAEHMKNAGMGGVLQGLTNASFLEQPDNPGIARAALEKFLADHFNVQPPNPADMRMRGLQKKYPNVSPEMINKMQNVGGQK